LWAIVASFPFSSLEARTTAPPSTSAFVYAGHFGPAGDAPGVLRKPTFLAVDPLTHDIFVSEYGNHRVQRFDQQGLPQGQIGSLGQDPGLLDGVQGLAVDPERRIL
jgi:DNA-binding beta-propeller fold protein YncE